MATKTDLTKPQYAGDIRVDSLLDDVTFWNYLIPSRNILYFTFDASADSYVKKENRVPVTAFNEAQKNAAQEILNHAAAVTGIQFVEVASSATADIHFGAKDITDSPRTAGICVTKSNYSIGPDKLVTEIGVKAAVYLDNKEFLTINAEPIAGNDGYEILLHEIGHALGLGHPFNTPKLLPKAQDHTGNTVMSYTSQQPAKSTFQAYDLLALQWIYGNDGLAGNWGLNSLQGPSLNAPPISQPPSVPVPPPAPVPPPVNALDTVVPTVVSISPAVGTVGVTPQRAIEIIFNEPIQLGAGHIDIYQGTSTAAPWVASIDIHSSNVAVVGSTLRLALSQPWELGLEYFVNVPMGSVQDFSGNLAPAVSTHFQAINQVRGQLYNTPRDDIFVGRAELETVVYNAPYADFNLSAAGIADTWRLNGDGNDWFQGIERLQFADQRIALDIGPTQNAGKALLVWHALHPDFIYAPGWIGQAIGMFDAGYSMHAVAQWALNALQMHEGTPIDHRDLVQRVYLHVVGQYPDVASTEVLLGRTDPSGARYSPIDFLVQAAQLDLNFQQLTLLGLHHTGIEYL
jgi:hypothetical protein